MAEHVWARVSDGTAYFCERCRMRVDSDEFSSEVEDSLCVPQEVAVVPFAPPLSTMKPAAREALEDMAEEAQAEVEKQIARDDVRTLVGFVTMMGYDVSPWQLIMLKKIDEEIEHKRGIQNASRARR